MMKTEEFEKYLYRSKTILQNPNGFAGFFAAWHAREASTVGISLEVETSFNSIISASFYGEITE